MEKSQMKKSRTEKLRTNGAIPQGYMTVGELAKRMNTTVRTLQYYDNEGLLSPSAESEGGRRLYTDKDMVMLHQIQSMKYLGFTLDAIKNWLVHLETPEEVADALEEQAGCVRDKIARLSETLDAVEKLKAETLRMDAVDWRKYAMIIANLQIKNEHYWTIKHFDHKALDHIGSRFGNDKERGLAVLNDWIRICGEAEVLQKKGAAPDGDEAQALAKEWWDMINEFTGGDASLLPHMDKFGETSDSWDNKMRKTWETAKTFLSEATETYFARSGVNPFEGDKTEGDNK